MKIDDSITRTYAQMSSGKRINSASDDAAGLSISENMKSQIKGTNMATDNAKSAKDLAQTAESALSSIGDSLQRIKEIAVQASNGTYNANDKKIMQNEINEIKSSIKETAAGTEFNSIKVLDGSFVDKNIATNPYGTGKTMSVQNSSLETLGIDKLDVTKEFDISTIDDAIAKVSASRGDLGATTNGLQTTVNTNEMTSENLSSADSRLEDVDIEKMSVQLKNQQLQQQAQIFAQKKAMEGKSSSLNLLA